MFPNAQPIKPWSAEGDSFSEVCSTLRQQVNSFWVESSNSADDSEDCPSPSSKTDHKSLEKDETPTSTPSNPLLEVSESIVEVADADVSSPPLSLDRQLESLIEMFFASQASSSISPTVNHTNSNSADGLIWKTPVSNIENNETSETIIEQPLVRETDSANTNNIYAPQRAEFDLSSSNESPINTPVAEKNTSNPKITDYWQELPINQVIAEPGGYHLDPQSPSPLIYPQRPPKGRKSLASVELPNFRPNGNQSQVKSQETNNQ
ncbi:MAG: hypothetical protein EAZ77_14340 [Nostocales cyanobacterium]|nr:MAG: hypothetical protein EAZ77_14340 [Nostocales cyanobacterium]